MTNKFVLAATCCLMAMSATFLGCSDNSNDPTPSSSQAARAVKAEAIYTVSLSAQTVSTSLNDVSLTIHYQDAAGVEQTKAITADGEKVSVMSASLPAQFKFYLTGSIKDNSKSDYDLGLTITRSIYAHLSDGSSQLIAQRQKKVNHAGVQNTYFINNILPGLNLETTINDNVSSEGEVE